MRNIWTIAKREYNHYFVSPIAYALAAVILLLLGGYFAAMLASANDPYSFGAYVPDVTQINGLFSFLLMLIVPALTMRLVADETRNGTIELMLTSPVTDFELVTGKWLGSFLFVSTLAAFTLVFPIIMNNYISPGMDMKTLISSYLGLILVSAALLSLGVGISAIFTNQFAAFFVTLGLFFFMWFFLGLIGSYVPKGGEVFNYLSLSEHFAQTMNNGTINLGDIVYYLSLTALGLFVGTTAIEFRRWR